MLRSTGPPLPYRSFSYKKRLHHHDSNINNHRSNGHWYSHLRKNASIKPAFLNQGFATSPEVSKTRQRDVVWRKQELHHQQDMGRGPLKNQTEHWLMNLAVHKNLGGRGTWAAKLVK